MSVSQISGLVSGLDTASLIDALVTARSGPISLLQRRQAEKTAELTAWQSFETVLLSLKIETERLAKPGLWDSLLVTPSDEEHLTATASGDAPLGEWNLFVEQLASAHQIQSDTFTSRDELVGEGTLSLTIDGETIDVEVASGTTLADLTTLINDADAGVTASVIRSESQGTESFHLVLTSDETGEVGQFTVDTSGLSGGTAPDFTVHAARDGQDAIVHFGGEGGLEIRSSTNRFQDLVEGLDLTVTRAHETGDSTSITIAKDTDGIVNRVKEFVDRYNAVMEFQNSQFRFDPEVGQRPPLMGSATLVNVTSTLRSRLLGPVPGLEDATFRTLAGIGLTSGANGTLSFSETDFLDALEEDPDAVADLFRTRARFDGEGIEWLGAPDGMDLSDRDLEVVVTQAAARATLTSATLDLSGGLVIDETNDTFQITIDGVRSEELSLEHGTYTDGTELAAALAKAVERSDDLGALSVRVSFEGTDTSGALVLSSQRYGSAASLQLHDSGSNFAADLGLSSVMGVRVTGEDVQGTIAGITAEGDGRVLRLADDAEQYGGISFRVTLDSISGSTTLNASFTEGIGPLGTRALENLTDPVDGTLANVSDSIQSLLDRYARDLQLKQEQLEIRRARLERQYASLESTLGQLQSQGQFLSAQISAGQGGRFGRTG